MKKISIKNLVLFTGVYGFLSFFVFMFLTWNGLSVWMGINVGFAMIPWITILYLYNRFIENNFSFDWISIVGLLFFIFFYPNSFYILTDFIHVDTSEFYLSSLYEGTSYLRIIDPYIMLSHIIVSAIIGAYAGIQSLLYLEEMIFLKYKSKRLNTYVFVAVLLLSSIGIYISRFLRFFSWDVLRPLELFKDFFGSLDLFAFAFIILFTVLELLIYCGYKVMFLKVENLK